MDEASFSELEAAIAARSPELARLLQPGLPVDAVSQSLKEAQITGAIAPLIELYSWRNGTALDESTPLQETAFFPNELYQFVSLMAAIRQMEDIRAAAAFHPNLGQGIANYFPMFWDNSTGFILLDLAAGNNNRVMLLEFEDVCGAREVYPSFDDFICDAIRANAENDDMAGFRTRPQRPDNP